MGTLIQSNSYSVYKSAYDGRDIIINTSPNMYLLPEENVQLCASVLKSIYSHYMAIISKTKTPNWDDHNYKVRKALIWICELYTSHNPIELISIGSFFDGYQEKIQKLKKSSKKNYHNGYFFGDIKRILGILRVKELIAMPLGQTDYSKNYLVGSDNPTFPYTPHADFTKAIDINRYLTINQDVTKGNLNNFVGYYRKIMTSCVNSKKASDITPEIYKQFINHNKQKKYRGDTFLNSIIRTQEEELSFTRFNLTDFYIENNNMLRGSGSFEWAIQQDPTLNEWGEVMRKFLSQVNGTIKHYIGGLNLFLDYLIEFPFITRNPHKFFRDKYYLSEPPEYPKYIRSVKGHNGPASINHHLYTAKMFFEWFLDEYCSKSGVVLSGYINPISDSMIKRVNINPETVRRALPQKVINLLIDILSANDFQWAKQFKHHHFDWYDKDNNEHIRVWSPVAAYFLLTKLLLPLRTYQVQMLDSGEFDHEQYDYENNVWEKQNAAKRYKKRKLGVLRKIYDTDTLDFMIGFFVNTNKTSDIGKNFSERGYEIPWQNDTLIRLFSDLIKFQSKYNAIDAPLDIFKMESNAFKSKWNDKTKKTMGSISFLFRDPTSRYKMEPISTTRVLSLWGSLLTEAEEHLYQKGERLHNGGRIKLVEKSKKRGRCRVLYDLHSLRVSLITSMFNNGVPPRIISKFIAGHATILMTMFYDKTGIGHITSILNDATKAIEDNEKEQFLHFLKDLSYEQLSENAIYNKPEGINNFYEQDSISWSISDVGICPVSMSQCKNGGKIIQKLNSKTIKYAPVLGGPSNCHLCRFFITGPPFVIGLSAKFNEVGLALLDLRDNYLDIEKKISKLEAISAHEGSLNYAQNHELNYLYNQYEKAKDNLDFYFDSWNVLYNLIRRCLGLLDDHPNAENNLLMLREQADLKMVFEDTRRFDLIDNICQTSSFYKMNIDSSKAQLQRGQILDALLSLNKKHPIFIHLSEDVALKVGNEMVKFLLSRVGQTGIHDLLDGKIGLNDYGLSDEIENLFIAPNTPLAITQPFIEITNEGNDA